MLDTRGSKIEYSRKELSEFKRIQELYTNDNRLIYAELLVDNSDRRIYFREWMSANGGDDSSNFAIVNTPSELKEELKKDVDHGDLAPGKATKIFEAASLLWDIN